MGSAMMQIRIFAIAHTFCHVAIGSLPTRALA